MRIEEPPFWRLGRPIRRVFTPGSSLISYGVILFSLIGVSLWTVFTRAYQEVCVSTQYISTEPALQNSKVFDACQPAIVYPGQTFSTANTLFIYKSLTLGNMTKPYPLEGCQVVDGAMMSSLNFPISTPTLEFNITFLCQSPYSDGTNKSVGFFDGQDITENSVVLTVDNFQGSPVTDDWFNQIRSFGSQLQNLTHSGDHCAGKTFMGWEIYGVADIPMIAYMSNDAPGGDDEPCIGSSENTLSDYDNALFTFFNNTLDLARQDLTQISPLPNLIFTCPSCSPKFLPWTQIVWLIAVALGSSWSIVFLLVTSGIAHVVTGSYDPEYDLWLRTASIHQNSLSLQSSRSRSDSGVGYPMTPGTTTSSTFLISRQPSRQASFAPYTSSPLQNNSSTSLYQPFSPLNPPDSPNPPTPSNPSNPPTPSNPSNRSSSYVYERRSSNFSTSFDSPSFSNP